MSDTCCCVEGCNNNSKYDRKVSWYRFPTKPHLRAIWLKHLKRKDLKVVLNPQSKICGAHVNKFLIKLTTEQTLSFLQGEQLPSKWLGVLAEHDPDVDPIEPQTEREPQLDKHKKDPAVGPMVPLTERQRQPQFSDILSDHNYAVTQQTAANLREMVVRVGTLCEDMNEQVETLKQVIGLKENYISKLNFRMSVLDANIDLKWTEFAKNPAAFKFFTNFNNTNHFNKLLSFVRRSYNECRTSSSGAMRQFHTVLPLADQLFLVLCRLKLGYGDKNLALNFNVTHLVYDRLWEFWLKVLHRSFVTMPIWPKQRPRQIILDCVQIDEWKGLLGVCPNGLVCFVSGLYANEMRLDQLTDRCWIFSCLEDGDEIFVDGEFPKETLIKEKKIIVNRTFKYEDGAICDCREGYLGDEQTAKVRTVVEREIRSLKEFKILRNMDELWSEKIYKICCYLLLFKRDDFIPKR